MSISVVSGFGPNLDVEMRPIVLFIILRSSMGYLNVRFAAYSARFFLSRQLARSGRTRRPSLCKFVRCALRPLGVRPIVGVESEVSFLFTGINCSRRFAPPCFCTTNAEVALRDALFSENHCCEYDTLRSHAVANTKREPDMPVTNLTYFQ
jgi:hypothetical protein